MEPIEAARVIEYCDEVIVDLQRTDDHGEFAAVSYQFVYERDGQTLSPKGIVDERHVPVVKETLKSEGFHRSPTVD